MPTIRKRESTSVHFTFSFSLVYGFPEGIALHVQIRIILGFKVFNQSFERVYCFKLELLPWKCIS